MNDASMSMILSVHTADADEDIDATNVALGLHGGSVFEDSVAAAAEAGADDAGDCRLSAGEGESQQGGGQRRPAAAAASPCAAHEREQEQIRCFMLHVMGMRT